MKHMENKQTAVEWLWNWIHEDFEPTTEASNKAFETAKQMEKDQMIKFADEYGFHICGYDYERAEKYYNETFNNGNTDI